MTQLVSSYSYRGPGNTASSMIMSARNKLQHDQPGRRLREFLRRQCAVEQDLWAVDCGIFACLQPNGPKTARSVYGTASVARRADSAASWSVVEARRAPLRSL